MTGDSGQTYEEAVHRIDRSLTAVTNAVLRLDYDRRRDEVNARRFYRWLMLAVPVVGAFVVVDTAVGIGHGLAWWRIVMFAVALVWTVVSSEITHRRYPMPDPPTQLGDVAPIIAARGPVVTGRWPAIFGRRPTPPPP